MDVGEDYHDSDYNGSEDYNSDYNGTEDCNRDDYDNNDDNNDIALESHLHQNYTVMSESDVQKLQEEDIAKLSNLLSISRVVACTLLRRYNWNSSKLHDEWFAEGGIDVGLSDKNEISPDLKADEHDVRCEICFETYPHSLKAMCSASCGHQYCRDCWTNYITSSINYGMGCLFLRCPEPSCKAVIGQDMIELFASDEDKDKYARFLLRSYIEVQGNMKWCPSPDCNFAVKFILGSENQDIHCKCGCFFCWNCTEEAHRPVDCATVTKWKLKQSSEVENNNWILAFSKPCPKCKRPIEKNQGCSHMTCPHPCNSRFCWSCLKSLKDHGACNRFVGGASDQSVQRAEDKKSVVKYMHYYDRFATNNSSRQKALEELDQMRSHKIEKLKEKVNMLPNSEFNFLIEAWEQIADCRRVLKWTYAYGYYFPEEEVVKKQLFEFLQGQAETALERLHDCAEMEGRFGFFEEATSSTTTVTDKFLEFKMKLAGLTTVTRSYFKNLENALENGLNEVSPSTCEAVGEFYWPCGACTYNNLLEDRKCEICGTEAYWF